MSADVQSSPLCKGFIDTLESIKDDRAKHAFVERMLRESPASLRKIGKDIGVSYEYVRKLVRGVDNAMQEDMYVNGSALLLDAIAKSLPLPYSYLCDIEEKYPELTCTFPSIDCTMFDVLRWWVGGLEVKDGRIFVPSYKTVEETTHSRIAGLVDDGQQYIERDVLDSYIHHDDSQEKALLADMEWLRELGYVEVNGHIIFPYRSLRVYSKEVLRALGKPATPREILDLVPRKRSVMSLTNILTQDEETIRITRTQWGLREWGCEEYTTIQEETVKYVLSHGGQVDVKEVMEAISKKFNASPNSVRSYMYSLPLQVRGSQCIFVGDTCSVHSISGRDRHVFYRNGCLLVHSKVTRDHLRGSGTRYPIAVAQYLDLNVSEEAYLQSPRGRVYLKCCPGVRVFGPSVRYLLQDKGIGEGHDVFFVIDKKAKTFDIEPLRKSTDNPLDKALAAVGHPPYTTKAAAIDSLNEAIGTHGLILATLAEKLSQRKDNMAARYIQEVIAEQ